MSNDATKDAKKVKPEIRDLTSLGDVLALYTRAHLEAGIKVPIFTPTGEATNGWLHICGLESTAYRKRQTEIRRRCGDLSDDKIEGVEDKREERDLDFACAFVLGWNLPIDFTPEALRDLLYNCPGLRERVVSYGVQPSLFFGETPFNCSPTPATSSG
jgi:hypothetical protein